MSGLLFCWLSLWAAVQPLEKEALAFFRAGEYVSAAAAFSEVLTAEPMNLAARFWRGRCWQELGHFAAAEADFRAVLEEKPTSVDTLYWLGRLYESTGQTALAAEMYARALALNPRYQAARTAQKRLRKGTRGEGMGYLPRVSVHWQGLRLDPAKVAITEAQVYDYTFTEAPTDWMPGGGVWEVTNRFACEPSWSFFGGLRRSGPAIVWNKRHFVGDLAVECYLALKHGLPWSGRWQYRPADLNLTLCGDGRNLSSGYSFIFSGDNARRTMILRREKVLAETSAPSALTPSFADRLPMESVHRRWWRVEARKIGGHLSFLVDGRLVLEADDPDPLPGGQVALWTVNNGLMVARIRIYYQQELRPTQPLFRLREPIPLAGGREPETGERGTNLSPRRLNPPPPSISPHAGERKEGTKLRVTSLTHPALENDFESDLGSCRPYTLSDPDAVRLTRLEISNAALGRRCLRVLNPHPGGEVGLVLIAEPFDVVRQRWLEFDYCFPPPLKINLLLRLRGRFYELGLTGPQRPRPRMEFLGPVPNIMADNQWHHARIDLLSYLRQVFPLSRRLTVQQVLLAQWHEEGYLSCGFGGNPAGMVFYLDNLRLYGAGGSRVELTWEPGEGETFTAYSYTFDLRPDTVPDQQPEGSEPRMVYEGVQQGTWYFHLRGCTGEGQWSPPLHYRVEVDNEPPQVGLPEPAPGARACPVEIRVPLTDAGAGLDPETVTLWVQGKAYDLHHSALRYDPLTQVLIFSPAAAGIKWRDGERVAVELKAADLLGHSLSEGGTGRERWTWTVDLSQDREPPRHLQLVPEGIEPLGEGTFEVGLDEWAPFGGLTGAFLTRTDETAASGRYSLRLECRQNGSSFGCFVRRTPFDAGKYRLVQFDYKIPPRLRVDFILSVNGRYKRIEFTDHDRELPKIGEVPNVVADGEWHHAEFNLYEMLRRDNPTAPHYIVRMMLLTGGSGFGFKRHPGNYAGTVYYLDNFHFVPLVSRDGLLRWTAEEPTELVGAEVAVAKRPFSPQPPPSRWVPGLGLPLAAVPEGVVYVWARVKDAAGNLSEPAQTCLWVLTPR